MRLQRCVAAVATACSFAQALAVPVEPSPVETSIEKRNPATSGDRVQRINLEWRDPSGSADNKYFHEPGSDDIFGHYDSRYFHGVVDYDTRTDTLHHMIRAYLLFFRERGLETWIAHGTLLGWWWNGKMLPWDWDIDTQVSGETLDYMGKNLNQTMHTYVSNDKTVTRDYLLDVNPYSRERDRGDGMNIIDARWIDVRNGLYIDITGLSETEPDIAPGVWACKNYHHYRTKDLYPMRESVYEGVPARIPYAYDKILLEEYKEKALVLTEYEGHVWNRQEKLWMRKDKNSRDIPEPISKRKRSLVDGSVETSA
ncbi:hypothetical protein BLS_002821 [Venturia inaequalis]|nr:hypothetical protein BLS_002821 [Venturia inaequalis]KAE9989313.1 hypothetical protein EG327_002860 [Venturia inaequalis]RDI87572.1 hypothetical protein Vi05172_g2422 [Venturia inaequalis]